MFLTERVLARLLFIVSTSLMLVLLGEAGQSVQYDPAKLRQRFRQVVAPVPARVSVARSDADSCVQPPRSTHPTANLKSGGVHDPVQGG